jgi:Mrp family chromosome partitioning ATPase
VADPRNTTSEDAARAIEALEPEEDKLIGIVLAEGDRPPLQRARVAEESRVPPSERRREDLVREAAR